MTRPTWLLFDLGGVLMDWAGPYELPAHLAAPLDADLRLKMASCAATDAFERGDISPQVFAERFVRDWGVRLAPAEFLERYVAWLRGLYPGAEDLLAQLGARYRLACLSNTNAAHWQQSEAMRWLQQRLDVALSSHQLKLRKPQPEIFAAALDRLGCAAGEVAYFDDLPANVAAARAAGFDAHHVDGFAALQRCIDQLGLLDD
jgi:HAD superfamily hydrolase (TIGR01509 family)